VLIAVGAHLLLSRTRHRGRADDGQWSAKLAGVTPAELAAPRPNRHGAATILAPPAASVLAGASASAIVVAVQADPVVYATGECSPRAHSPRTTSPSSSDADSSRQQPAATAVPVGKDDTVARGASNTAGKASAGLLATAAPTRSRWVTGGDNDGWRLSERERAHERLSEAVELQMGLEALEALKSSQVKSSQVKSSQIKSNQVHERLSELVELHMGLEALLRRRVESKLVDRPPSQVKSKQELQVGINLGAAATGTGVGVGSGAVKLVDCWQRRPTNLTNPTSDGHWVDWDCRRAHPFKLPTGQPPSRAAYSSPDGMAAPGCKEKARPARASANGSANGVNGGRKAPAQLHRRPLGIHPPSVGLPGPPPYPRSLVDPPQPPLHCSTPLHPPLPPHRPGTLSTVRTLLDELSADIHGGALLEELAQDVGHGRRRLRHPRRQPHWPSPELGGALGSPQGTCLGAHAPCGYGLSERGLPRRELQRHPRAHGPRPAPRAMRHGYAGGQTSEMWTGQQPRDMEDDVSRSRSTSRRPDKSSPGRVWSRARGHAGGQSFCYDDCHNINDDGLHTLYDA